MTRRVLALGYGAIAATAAAALLAAQHGLASVVQKLSALPALTLQMGFGGCVLALALAAGLAWFFIARGVQRAELAKLALLKARDDAIRAESEANEMAILFRDLNDDVTRLNIELAGKMRQLGEAQEDILRKGKMAQLGALITTVGHELRNPMAGVRTTLFAMRRKFKSTSLDLDSYLNRIDGGITRCDLIITKLLDFAYEKEPDLAPGDVDGWLAGVIEEEAKSLPEQICIECELGLDGLVTGFDRARMRRVIHNLLSNAADALWGLHAPVRDDPCIRVTTSLAARGVEISIADNGPGISAEVMVKVREPLFTTKEFATGLGIPSTEKILALHGGGLDIESAPNKGATFTAWFPLSRAVLQAA
ncbi:sensor histidine kinase [Aestuariivirga sp.]|uniref:sensor histidine kinase n=1 Tax=Aestuariivirga sp. TaxID=2650926 RepID=UPI0039E436C3